jgi:selenide,water dikinase
LPLFKDPNVLVGLERPDDAGVYRLSEETALVQTVDFFTPIVDDPATFGRIAAANSLSDCWAMGGRPVCAMNVVCFPSGEMGIDVLRQILAGGLEALREAEVALVGGHSVEGPELKYGLSVTGVVHPERILTSAGARPGDKLVLTKPIGTGVVATAVKGGLAEEGSVAAAAASMVMLNRRAGELMLECGARACTDVTGFGLLGHASETVEAAEVGLVIRAGAVPLLPGAKALAGMGLLPGGLHRNREFYGCRVVAEGGVPDEVLDLLYDPQTSGGLLVVLDAESAEAFVAALHGEGAGATGIIGEFVADRPGKVTVKP